MKDFLEILLKTLASKGLDYLLKLAEQHKARKKRSAQPAHPLHVNEVDPTLRPLRILFDGMIVTDSILEQPVLVPTEFNWGGRTVVRDVAQDVPRTYRGQTRQYTAQVLESLSQVAELARSGKITCYSSQEIVFETMGRPRRYSLAPGANPFKGVQFERCRLPYLRSVVFGGIGQDKFEEEKEKFLKSIPDARFRVLDRATGGHHSADCYHLWTAELNELDVFLTRETKFKKAFLVQRKVTSKVRILLPEELSRQVLQER